MSSEESFKEGRVQITDGEVEFDIYTIDGIGLPPFPPMNAPGGFPKMIKDIMDMEIRPDDVILATILNVVSTHWTDEILNMLLQGKPDYKKSVKVAAMLEAAPDLKMTADLPSPRVLSLHLPYRWFPKRHIENGGKIIHVTRNPKDAYVSMFHFSQNRMSFGPNAKNKTWKQYFDNCVVGEASLYGTWFSFEKDIAAAKKINKNIYTLRFEDLKKESEREIEKLAQFLGVDATDDLVRGIAEKCSFENLKKANEVKDMPQEMKEKFAKSMGSPPVIYRKGEVGDWKNHFTVAQSEQFDDIYRREMEGVDVDVSYEPYQKL